MSPTLQRFSVFFILTILCTACFAIDGTGTLISGGISRTFNYHAPGSAVAPNLPVVIIMHGDGGTGAGFMASTGFNATADANNFLAIYPDAIAGAWNRYVDGVPGDAGLGNPGAPDDVLFISNLIDYVCANYNIDATQVYATGHSAGGFMAYNLAVQLNDKIAAFAPVSADLWGDSAFVANYIINNYVPVPICHIHGDADGTVPYMDGNHTADSYGEYPLFMFSVGNCTNDTYTATNVIVPGVEQKVFCNGTGNLKVELIRCMGVGHVWPNTIPGFNPNQYIWNFCNAYSLSAANCNVGVESMDHLKDITLYPVPATDQLNISGELTNNAHAQIIDGFGKLAFNVLLNGEKTLKISELPNGIYFITIVDGNASAKFKFIKQ